MVYLITDGRAAGVAETPQTREIKSPYTTFEEAYAQAEADLASGRTPLRIIDGDTGALLWMPGTLERSETEQKE